MGHRNSTESDSAGNQMIYITATSKTKRAVMTDNWSLWQAATLGALVGATYVLAMFSISHVISFKSLSFVFSIMFIGATVGASTTLGIAALLNLVKRTERKRAATLNDFTTLALARLA